MTDQIFYEELRATVRDAVASYVNLLTDEELRELATESLNTPALPGGWRVADHKDNGRVIVTTPNNDGRVYYVLPSDLDGLGFDWFFCDHSELAYLNGDQ